MGLGRRLAQLVLILVLVAAPGISGTTQTDSARVDPAPPARRPILPLLFEPDRAGASFLAEARGYTMTLSARGATIAVRRADDAGPIVLTFAGGGGRLAPERRLATTINRVRGPRSAWRTGIATYGAVRLSEVYPGIDAVFYGSDREVEYDLVVAPGADARKIRLRFAGVERVSLEDEQLRLTTSEYTLTQRAPFAYQDIRGHRTQIDARYAIASNGDVTFSLGPYDTSEPLVIDPTITYSTFFGGTGPDEIRAIASDASGNLYVAGLSDGGDFPVANRRPHSAPASTDRSDAYVAKLRRDGTPEWLTFLGGSDGDGALALALGPDGDAYVTGFTRGADFPVTAGAYSTSVGPDQDSFVARLSPDGALRWSTLLGAPQPWDGARGTGIAVDPLGRPLVVGVTASPSFEPTIRDSFAPVRPGLNQPDAFVARFSADGARIEWSRLLAGSYHDVASAVALDRFGNALVAGSTTSSDFPVRNAINPRKFEPGDPGGLFGYDGFVSVVWDDGTVGFSTYLGGSGEDSMNAVVIGQYDRAYVGGTTNSPDASFYKPSAPGQYNGIMYHLTGRSDGLLQSRPVGGTGFTAITSLTVGKDWSIWAAGYTDGQDFQVNGPDDPVPQKVAAGGLDMFVQKWGPDINSLYYSYLLGGTGDDRGLAVALDPLGDIYVGGTSVSADFPVKNAVQPARRDSTSTSTDGVLTKLGCYLNPFLPAETQPAAGGAGRLAFHAVDGCFVEAVSDSAWLRITGVDGTTVSFTTDPNPTGAERVATITLSSKKVAPIVQAAGSIPGTPATTDEIVLNARDVAGIAGNWQVVPDAVHGTILAHPDRGQPKIATAHTNPAEWFTFTFTADAGRPYHLWIHGRAQGDSWQNDSIYAQFSDAVDASGNPVYRIGTTSATWISLEECSGCGEMGWGWQDNQYGARGDLGPDIYFATSGTHTIKFQVREDGFDIGQVVLSAKAYLRTAPGGAMNDPTIVAAPQPAPPPAPAAIDEIVLWASDARVVNERWQAKFDPTAAGQVSVWNPDLGTPKLSAPPAEAAGLVEFTFNAEAGKPYHLWLRMKADNDHWTNDSVWVQFSGSVDASGAAVSRIGTASATWVSLEECSGCGEQGWGWQDNQYGSPGDLGAPIYFAASGSQIIRIQNREDGVAIDQIVLSASRYATVAPGSSKNDTTILARTPR